MPRGSLLERGCDRVALPRVLPSDVGEASPQVDDRAPVDLDGERCTELEAIGEAGAEGIAHGLEPRIAVAVDARLDRHGAATLAVAGLEPQVVG